MANSKWIWYPGDYEIYHSLQLHSRREEFGAEYPSMWSLSNVYPRVTFTKGFFFEKDDRLTLHANGKAYILVDGKRYPRECAIDIPAGGHWIEIAILKENGGLPAIYCESDQLGTDETWMASPGTPGVNELPAGCEPAYTSPTDNVEVFPFEYTEILPVSVEEADGMTTVDFGKELFAKLDFTAASDVTVCYGETLEEASDPDGALLYETVCAGKHSLVPRAFRFVRFMATGITDIRAWLELLPVTVRAKFSCNDPEVEKLFGICAYTFHLNSREFLLDGIKRDRWCWSGDAYQSYLVNDYLFADRALNRRTITALYGKPPYFEHINRINDYSALLLIGTWEYYLTTGDEAFIQFIYPRAKALYDFIVGRLDEDGLVVARKGDWIFIDWSDIDKGGPLCAEQILLWQVYNAMEKLSEVAGEPSGEYRLRADALRKLINKRFWDAEKRAYIDTYTSGRRNVTRHAAIFAILYDFVDRETAEVLVESVLENDAITKITTPYFELYELMAFAKMGQIERVQDMIDSYWGGMVRLGATTIWEEYDPTKTGAEHYSMYGSRYGKSLCHAWGSGPVLLLGRYCLGVYPTAPGAKTFMVEPNPGRYTQLDGTVPLGDGNVRVRLKDGCLTVDADIPGGQVKWNGKTYAMEETNGTWILTV